MSNLVKLLEELCPNGVEYKSIIECCKVRKGQQLKLEDRIPGPFPVVTASRSESFWHELSNFVANKTTVTSHGAYAGHVNYWDTPIWLSNNVFLLDEDETILDARFFYYCIKSNEINIQNSAKGGGIPYLNARDFTSIKIPLPPMEVQLEIARILDAMTSLKQELLAELEARRIQHDFYRTRLVKDISAVEMKLGDIGKIAMCKRIMKSDTSASGEIPFYKIGTFGKTPDAFISREKFESFRKQFSYPNPGEILISAAGTIGRTVVFDGTDAYFQDSNIVWIKHDESIILNSYLKHVLQTISWTTDGGTIQRLYNSRILEQRVFVPSMAQQVQIANVLDQFETLVHDTKFGLPAEINARQKQYEYYRDQLLSFKELAA